MLRGICRKYRYLGNAMACVVCSVACGRVYLPLGLHKFYTLRNYNVNPLPFGTEIKCFAFYLCGLTLEFSSVYDEFMPGGSFTCTVCALCVCVCVQPGYVCALLCAARLCMCRRLFMRAFYP